MTALWKIFRLVLAAEPVSLRRGAMLSLVVLLMGAGLLGLSGWFITAAAAAGLAGLGAVFDVFRPSAMVRFLALGRAAARYGERLLTHDATLRALEVMRGRLLSGLMAAPYGRMIRIRGAQALNRLTADIDALDGVPLRLVLPVLSGVMAQAVAFVALWLLVDWRVALWVFAGYVLGTVAIFARTARQTAHLSRRAEAAAQAFRSRLIDMIRARRDLAVQGRLVGQAELVLAAEARRITTQRAQDQAERMTGAALVFLSHVVAGGALWIGLVGVQSSRFEPSFAALGFFVALALAETTMPLRRAASDLGRMAEAARRVVRDIAEPEPKAGREGGDVLPLRIEDLTVRSVGSPQPLITGLSLRLGQGETLALTGPSGSGKSTLLLAIAGLHPLAAGCIVLGDLPVAEWSETALRAKVCLLPQRSALMAGTVAEALRLAAPDSSDDRLHDVLEAVQLTQVLVDRGGLQMQIGPRGEGLSGGEMRLLTLARALLRQPKLLLLDEPTEGLDTATAEAVLHGIRRMLPEAAILIAAHRAVETRFADRIVKIG